MARQFGKWFAEGIAHFESGRAGGLILKAERDSNGVWTGPNGMTRNEDGSPVTEGQTWTEAEAIALYNKGKEYFSGHVEKELGDLNAKVTQIMFDGLGLLCWNIGRTAFSRSSVLKSMRAGNFEDAAANFLLWRGDTLNGGHPGPDGKPVRDPDGNELPVGIAWFKLFRGLYRRSMYAALLFSKRDPAFAANAANIALEVITTKKRADYYYDVMVPEKSTSWRDALDNSRLAETYTPSVEEVSAPAVDANAIKVPDDWHLYTESEQVAWLNTGQLRELQKKGGDPVSPQVVPAAKVERNVRPADQVEYLSDEAKAAMKVKKVSKSKRGQGFANKKIGGVMGTAAIAGMAAEQIGAVEPVLKAADTYGTKTIGYVLLGCLGLALLVYLWGVVLQRWGEDDADTYLE